jgi:hypothetical protein
MTDLTLCTYGFQRKGQHWLKHFRQGPVSFYTALAETFPAKACFVLFFIAQDARASLEM